MKKPWTQKVSKALTVVLLAIAGLTTTASFACGCGKDHKAKANKAQPQTESAIYIHPTNNSIAIKYIPQSVQPEEKPEAIYINPYPYSEQELLSAIYINPYPYSEQDLLSAIYINPYPYSEQDLLSAIYINPYPYSEQDLLSAIYINPYPYTDQDLLGAIYINPYPYSDDELLSAIYIQPSALVDGSLASELGTSQDYAVLASDQWEATAAIDSPYYYHWLKDLPAEKNAIVLEDGSTWVFDGQDKDVINKWAIGDSLVLTPKSNWTGRSNYAYQLSNKQQDTTASVNLSYGPHNYGKDSLWVSALNRDQGQIHLIKGNGERSLWEISGSERYLLDHWSVNDRVIIGKNNSWFYLFSPYDHILFNADASHDIHVRNLTQEA